MQIITTNSSLEAAVAKLMTTEVVAVDTEFMREKTYWPQLCLIQIAACIGGSDEVFLIDPLGDEIDVRLLAQLWGSASILKVFHAGFQDLQILHTACGVVPAPYFDTQEASALIGCPGQISYGALAGQLLGVELAKEDRFTDWARRPLTDAQIAYAAEDVSALLTLYPLLLAEMKQLGRDRWLDEFFAHQVEPQLFEIDPDQMFRRLKRVSSLKPHQLAIAREVAAWREREVMKRDIPRRWLISDEGVLEIARKAPQTAWELEQLRGIGKKALHSMSLIAAVRRGQDCPPDQWPVLAKGHKIEGDYSALLELMVAVTRKRAEEHRIAPTLLASRALLEEYVRSRSESSPLLQGWRKELIGDDIKRLLEGKIGMRVHGTTVVLEELG